MAESPESLHCPICGEHRLEIKPHHRIAHCPVCDASVILPDLEDHEILALLDQAYIQRSHYEFDAAKATYQFILSKKPDELSAYEGILFAEYGIVYVHDERTGRSIPTCHRYNVAPIQDDPNYRAYLEICQDEEERKIFIDRMAEILHIQEQIAESLQNEADYDVFISHKSRDAEGHSTLDSMIARDIYDELTAKGFRVFLSSVSLKSRLTVDYEPIIYRALHSSKIFILVGTSKEHIEAPWVRNEWSRFIDRVKNPSDDVDRTRFLCVYRDMDPNLMPRIDYRLSQCVDASDLSYRKNISDYVSNILKPSEEKELESFLRLDKKLRKKLDEEHRKAEEAKKAAEEAKAAAEEEKRKRKEAEERASINAIKHQEAKALAKQRKQAREERKAKFKATHHIDLFMGLLVILLAEGLSITASITKALNPDNFNLPLFWVCFALSLLLAPAGYAIPTRQSRQMNRVSFVFLTILCIINGAHVGVNLYIGTNSNFGFLCALLIVLFAGVSIGLGWALRLAAFVGSVIQGKHKRNNAIRELDLLLRNGIISKEEYDKRKKDIA